MRPLHIIMPMAGEGRRFVQEGWKIPKPLIELNGKPLFMRAIHSVHIDNALIKYSFVVRKEHIDKYGIDEKIKFFLPQANIFYVDKSTRGAVETCLVAEEVIREEESILVMDCDLEFRSNGFLQNIKEILNQPIQIVNGGLLVSFESTDPRFSYAEVDENDVVIRTAEKEVISNHALCGAYFFSSANGFLKAAHSLLSESVFSKPEYYVSLLYNYLLANGETVKLETMEEYYSYGTPEELKRYL